MAGALQKFARGALATGGKLLADQAMDKNRARLTAARDAKLASFQKDATALATTERKGAAALLATAKVKEQELDIGAQSSLPSQRLAASNLEDKAAIRQMGEDYIAAETDEEKQKIREAINLQKGSIGKRYLSAGSKVFDLQKGEFLVPPITATDMRKTAAGVAKDIFNAQKSDITLLADDRKTYKDIFKEIMETLGYPDSVGDSTDLPEGVTEEDIKHTMKLHSMTRKQVLAKLSGG